MKILDINQFFYLECHLGMDFTGALLVLPPGRLFFGVRDDFTAVPVLAENPTEFARESRRLVCFYSMLISFVTLWCKTSQQETSTKLAFKMLSEA